MTKRNAFSIVARTVLSGRPAIFGSSATREAAEKRAGQWSRNPKFRHADYVFPLVVMTREEYEAELVVWGDAQ